MKNPKSAYKKSADQFDHENPKQELIFAVKQEMEAIIKQKQDGGKFYAHTRLNPIRLISLINETAANRLVDNMCSHLTFL